MLVVPEASADRQELANRLHRQKAAERWQSEAYKPPRRHIRAAASYITAHSAPAVEQRDSFSTTGCLEGTQP